MLVVASSDAPSHVKALATDMQRSLSTAGTSTAETITAGAREAQSTLLATSTDTANQIKSLTVDVQRSLSIAGTTTAEVITAGAREAQTHLINASSEASNHVKSLAAEWNGLWRLLAPTRRARSSTARATCTAP